MAGPVEERGERIRRLREKAMRLPLHPGVYLMRDKTGKIIYIGKAKALKNRVSQYFGSEKNHEEKVRKMVSHVADFEYILTDSEFEALILECSLIKQHTPKYNILLKDDKGYHYIKVTGGAWPKIQEANQMDDPEARYVGPYMSSWAVKQAIDEARKIFRLPSCTRRFPQDIGRGRPCLNYYIKQCAAPCRGGVGEEEYRETVAEALEFLRGGSAATVRLLTQKMEDAAERMEFETAARIRDRIAAIRKMADRQKVVQSKLPEQDVVALAQGPSAACFEVFRFRDSRLCDRETFLPSGRACRGGGGPGGIFAAVLHHPGPCASARFARRRRRRCGSAGGMALAPRGAESLARRAAARRTGATGGDVPQQRGGAACAVHRAHRAGSLGPGRARPPAWPAAAAAGD